MLTHHVCLHEPIDIHWQRPVLPDRGPTSSPIESPISRRLLDSLQLAPADRLLAVGTGDPQFLEVAVDAVGPHGHVTCIEPDLDRLRRLRRGTSHLGDDVALLPDLARWTHNRYDAIAVVVRTRTVPEPSTLGPLIGRLDAGGRLAVVAFEAPAGRIASSGVLRPHPTCNGRSRRPTADAPVDQSASHLRAAS